MAQVREYQITIPQQAGAFNVDLNILHGITIYDAWVIKTTAAGGAAREVQLANQSGSVITDVFNINVADGTVVRAGSIDDATNTVTAAQGLRAVVDAQAGNSACILTVLGVPTATP